MTPISRTACRIALPILLLSGCAVGPDFHPPAAPKHAGYTKEPLQPQTAATALPGGAAQRFVPGGTLSGAWWTLFRSRPLNHLIDQALRANPDLQAAQAALREANENVYAGQGAFFPRLGANAQVERERLSGAAFGQPHLNETLTLTTAALNVSYAPDVFGGVRRQVESLAAQAEYQRFQLEATYLTLTSNLVVAAVQEASLRGQIAATRDIIRLETGQLKVVGRQFELGGAAKSDVLSQQATLSATEATLPSLEKQLAQTRDQLTALLGRFPNQQPAARFDLASLRLPTELPLSLPSQLVAQRPDIRAARATLHTASANVGVAIANQLPQFSITGQYGSETLGLSNLFTPATAVWSIAGGVAQTLFDGGALLHKKRAAVAAFDQAAALYRSTVVKAFQNVADALRALQADAAALRAQAEAEQTAGASLDLARSQFRFGAITYLTLADAERTYQQAHIGLVQAQASRYADTAALFQALGGGWWHRHDVAPDAIGPPDRVGFSISATQH
ncbi:MAG TPA: efflux transporter outer membrane subunit [Acetobacteraceae bacterium]|nr:efflux transporter outer membrane subunit [Acetobacteraceae bacterium]